MSRIKNIVARRIWDSRGMPTVEVEVLLENGTTGRGIAPAGASRGANEGWELRDGGTSFGGKDVLNAIAGVNREIAPALKGMDITDQQAADLRLIELDGTPNKSRLGANALIATSMAVLHAAANNAQMPLWRYLARGNSVQLPIPQIQIFGGGAHAGRRVDVQDFMVIATGAASFQQALEMTAEVYRHAGLIMQRRGTLMGVADEGGWWPAFAKNEDALDTLVEAIEAAGYVPGQDVSIALDIAASEFYADGKYKLALDETTLDSDGFAALLLQWIDQYPIVSIEDPLAEDDEQGLIAFTRQAGKKVQIVGDDYLVTDAARIKRAAALGACNAVLIKPNQIGTITETHAAVVAAKEAGFRTIVSARSGETEDTTIVHLATGWNAGQLKVGSFARSERMAKWNEGIRLETASDYALTFAGKAVLAGRRGH
ncbi:MAG: phosphopyruvate hydratase [Burkholderiaceae bacterium]